MFIRIFATGLPRLNEARARLGLEPIHTVPEVFERADRVLVLSSQAFDYHSDGLSPNLCYVGAQLDDPAWAEPWQSPWEANHPDPLVVVGLSTTNQGQGKLLQRVADALGQLPVRGLVTTGPSVDPATLRAPANVVVLRSAPHAQVFREADAVVTHAGHGTVIRALASGLPLVCIPMGRDQPDIAARVVHRGAGLRLSPGASPAKLRTAIQRVVTEPHFREAAQRLAAAIALETESDSGVEELESLAARRVRVTQV
jgi:MGT family glycosyltransferase